MHTEPQKHTCIHTLVVTIYMYLETAMPIYIYIYTHTLHIYEYTHAYVTKKRDTTIKLIRYFRSNAKSYICKDHLYLMYHTVSYFKLK